MAVWPVPKLGTEMLEIRDPALDIPRTVCVACAIFLCFCPII